MTVPSYSALAPSYTKLWANLVPSAQHQAELTKISQGLLAHKATYQAVSQTVWAKPDYWYVVALIDQMEGGGGANTYLGNGQSLARPTTEVPAGRGPFASFHDGALDALHLDGLDKVTAWPVEAVAYHLEAYNGWGYLNKPINDPYLASWSNEYTSGKYVSDHVYDPNAVSEQPGALAILKVLVTLDPSIQLGAAAPQEAPVTTTTAPTPVTTMPQIDLGALIGALLPHITAPGAPAAAPATTATTTVTAAVAPHAPTPVTTMPQIDLGALIGALLPHITAPGAPATAPTTTATAVTPQISLASIVAHLDLLMPVVKIVMGFIPEAAPFIPLLTVAQTLAHAAADAQTALQTNPAALGTVLSGALTNIAPLLQQVKGAMPQLASVADAVQKAAHTPAIAPATK